MKKKKIHQQYEFGAHFKYTDLFSRLIDLINYLPKERLGNNGVYFQDDNLKNQRNSVILDHLNDNIYQKFNIEPSQNKKNTTKNSNLISFKFRKNLKLNRLKTIDNSKPSNPLLLYNNYLVSLPNKKYKYNSNNFNSCEKNYFNSPQKNKTTNYSIFKNNRNKKNDINKISNFNTTIFNTVETNINKKYKLPKIDCKYKLKKNDCKKMIYY